MKEIAKQLANITLSMKSLVEEVRLIAFLLGEMEADFQTEEGKETLKEVRKRSRQLQEKQDELINTYFNNRPLG